MTKITSDDVRKVATLARLNLPEDLIDTYTSQLEKILGYVAQLEEVDTEDIPPTSRAVEVTNVLREDIIQETDIREDLINLAPNREGDFFRVPKILSE
ncbi:Asp-tRNA(Asn)/Glu-tRNA(Gln) amidotransferase subunit GatC [Prochlorococcus marinus]|uniref:Aspartyl/glutamyl-tRNA(Asn/Gln) amidotransferase subunit C n=1 Tax=Prochlorococcus marinus (strain MIT 9211) TaxID=93059 RepID=GATC_PROM4|nr:Asp-tRNA(Asn)/Glu-tRNA(Gln) amidotransferase subunit GatC [Prochlorococcus marinus]A9BDK3.1 RecName: Full=Aspartyl/glutamyl-tRNA(Asn/Gln) amidotransferase subunit C; Short=Asp/Glu-ADT subunit C [Prochlorococcus marinus str. MIT 9211]ABX08189.1 Glutamyl-tRNA(Gln) amidotransferase subunit C [Prochlorococcus marinus str. MIT 9211]